MFILIFQASHEELQEEKSNPSDLAGPSTPSVPAALGPEPANTTRPTGSFQIYSRIGQFSPSSVRQLPKAPPRKVTNRGKQRGHTAILTDTPEKNALAAARSARKTKPRKSTKSKNGESSKGKGKQIAQADTQQTWHCLVCDE